MKYLLITIVVIVLIHFFRTRSRKTTYRFPREDQKIFQNGFAVIDFETTGLSPQDDDIIQAGAAIYVEGVETAHFMQYANPGRHIPAKITSLTGITDDMVRDADEPASVIAQMIDFIQGYPVVGHNIVSFDLKFLNKYAPNYRPATFDTLTISRRYNTNLPNHKLATLKTYYGIHNDGHDALNDVRATAIVFLELADIADLRFPNWSDDNIERLDDTLTDQRYHQQECAFTDADRTYMDALTNIIKTDALTFSKTSKYLIVNYYRELIRIKHGGRVQYILFPWTIDEPETAGLEVSPSPKSESAYTRVMINDIDDLKKLSGTLNDHIKALDKQLSLDKLIFTPRYTI